MPSSPRLALPGALQTTAITLAASGDIITPTSGYRANVVSLFAMPTSALVTTFRFGTTNLTGAISVATSGIFIPALMIPGMSGFIFPLWSGAVDEKFNVVLGSAVQLSGCVWWFEDKP